MTTPDNTPAPLKGYTAEQEAAIQEQNDLDTYLHEQSIGKARRNPRLSAWIAEREAFLKSDTPELRHPGLR